MSSDADVRLLHTIEFEAGTSNTVVLSESEAIAAKDLLSNAERNLQALELQIAELPRKHERDMAQLKRLRTAVAPHKRLPTELLSYVLRLSTEDEPFKIPPDPDPTPPWTLRHVCSRWRNIALAHRNLWNSVAVNLGTSHGRKYQETMNVKKAARLLDIILPKAGLISISIMLDGYFSRDNSKKAIDTLIGPHSSRVVDLSIGLPGDAFYMLYTMFPSHFNCLESLELEFLSPGIHGHRIPALPPNLRKLTMSSDHDTCYPISSKHINWSNITDLNLCGIQSIFSEVFTILKYCENLESCAIDVCACNIGPLDEKIDLPHLSDFNVSFDDAAIFDAFSLPSLIHLTMEHEGSRFPATEITSMIRRSGCALEDLVYCARQALQCDSDALDAMLALTPSLQTLDISDVTVPRPILERFGNRKLLPNLKTLECLLDSETRGTFLDVIECRLRGDLDGASNGALRSAVGIYAGKLHPIDDTQALVHRASRLCEVYDCNVRLFPST